MTTKTKEEWTYLGRAWLKSKTFHRYRRVDGEHALYSRPLGAPKGSRVGDVIGGRYQVTLAADGTTALGTAQYKGLLGLAGDELAEHHAADDAAAGEAAAYARLKKARGENPVHDALGPVRAAYRLASRAGRRAILADLIEFITGGGR